VDTDFLPKHHLGRELLGLGAEWLTLLRAVNSVQPDLLSPAVVQDLDGVSVGHTNDAAGEVSSESVSTKTK